MRTEFIESAGTTTPASGSLWEATAAPGPMTPPLVGTATVDVLVVGAGYTGLSTALHLAETGTSVMVLDTHSPGWGASGRNGGQVNPTLKHDPDDLVRMLGPQRAEPLIHAVSQSADLVFGLVDRFGIDCAPVRSGWLQVAYSDRGARQLHARAAQWARRGVAAEPLDAAAVARRSGSRVFAGGWNDGRAGGVQPLAYARGLARAVLGLGARIHGRSAVVDLRREGSRWTATTASGASVSAERVVLATNGYTGPLWPGLAQTVLAANSFISATRPLPRSVLDGILPLGQTLATSQRLLIYLRRDAHDRLLIGGRGPFKDTDEPAAFQHLERALALIYPQLGPLDYQFRWGGRVAITRDFMPHVHEPEPGITMALGFNGRGIAMGTAMGRHLAHRLTSSDAAFPFPVSPIQTIPLHGLQRFYVAAGVAWYALLDQLKL
jgi:glycine/D-amino acid oxidase-like deaminating enzyme